MSNRGPTETGRGCGSLVAQAAAMKNPHLPMTESWHGECRPPLKKSTCVLGDSWLLSDFRPNNLPAFAWQATGDISAEVFSMSKLSAWRLLVKTATSI